MFSDFCASWKQKPDWWDLQQNQYQEPHRALSAGKGIIWKNIGLLQDWFETFWSSHLSCLVQDKSYCHDKRYSWYQKKIKSDEFCGKSALKPDSLYPSAN